MTNRGNGRFGAGDIGEDNLDIWIELKPAMWRKFNNLLTRRWDKINTQYEYRIAYHMARELQQNLSKELDTTTVLPGPAQPAAELCE